MIVVTVWLVIHVLGGHRGQSLSAFADIWTVLDHGALGRLILIITIARLEHIGRRLLLLTGDVELVLRSVGLEVVPWLSVVALWLVTATHANLSSDLTRGLRLLRGTQGHCICLIYAVVAIMALFALTHSCTLTRKSRFEYFSVISV